jgi:hypothetical protein
VTSTATDTSGLRPSRREAASHVTPLSGTAAGALDLLGAVLEEELLSVACRDVGELVSRRLARFRRIGLAQGVAGSA